MVNNQEYSNQNYPDKDREHDNEINNLISTKNEGASEVNQKSEAKKQIWELNQEKEREAEEARKKLADKAKEIAEKDQQLAEANTKGNNLLEKLTTFEKNQKTREAEQEADFQEQTKKIESKERVELTEIKQKYEAELQKAQTQEQEIVVKNQALSDYIRLVNQQELRIEILKGEWEILHSKKKELTVKNLLLDNEVEKEKGNVELITNSKNREIETWTIKFDTEKHENEQKHQEILKKILEIRDKNNEIIDLEVKINELLKLQAEDQNLKEIVSTNNSPFHEFWLIGMGMVISLIIFGLYRIATKILKLPGASSAEKIKKRQNSCRGRKISKSTTINFS